MAIEEQWKIAPSRDVIATGAIGAPELLPIGYSHEITSRVGPRSRKTLVLLAAFVSCALVFAFGGEEAQAQQLPQEQQQNAAINGQAAEKIVNTLIEAAPIEETSPREARRAKTPPIELAPSPVPGPVSELPAGQPARPAPDDPATAEPKLPIEPTLPANAEPVTGPALQSGTVSELVTGPAGQDGPEAPVDPDLAPLAPGSPASNPVSGSSLPEDDAGPRPETTFGLEPVPPGEQETAPGPVDPDRSPLAPEPERVAIEEDKPLSLLAGEAAAAEPANPGEEESSYPVSALGTSVVGAVATLEEALGDAAADALGALVNEARSWPAAAEGEGLIGTTLASLFSGGGAGHSSTNEHVQEPGSSSTGTESESPLKDAAPQPVSPFAPPAGSTFSLSGGQVGPGGVVLLLLCVLASGLILLRRDFKLLWAFCELPKPSSALRLPLERPG